MAEVVLPICTSEPGTEVIQVDVTITAGANASSAAVTFKRPFAAVPRILGITRVDANANDVGQGSYQVVGLTKSGFTSIQLRGTSTVDQTVFVTILGNYNNPKAF